MTALDQLSFMGFMLPEADLHCPHLADEDAYNDAQLEALDAYILANDLDVNWED